MSIVLLLVFFAVAWVLLILPRQRELRRHRALMEVLDVDDEVITASGLYGTIRAIDGEVVGLEVAPGIELRIAKRAVAAKVEPDDGVVDLTDDKVIDNGSTPPDRPDVAGS
jgi:preprotein translocase subunit YajC